MRAAQNNLFEYFEQTNLKKRYGRTQYGGVRTNGHRKVERPLNTRRPIHLVLKSDKAKGALSFLTAKNQMRVKRILFEKARKFGILIGDYANVGNHLHLKIRISSRRNFQAFLKSTTALIARTVTGARKGKPFGRFWQGLAFTRVLTTSLEELNLKGYIEANRIEAARSRQAREIFLNNFNKWVRLERQKSRIVEKPNLSG